MTKELPRISVVVIGRNEAAHLARCLESVRAADYPQEKIELVYVDSASTDNSRDIVADLGVTVIATQPQRPSAAAARNAGIGAVGEPFVQFLDGDTILHPSWLKTAVGAFEDPEIACVFGRVDEMRPDASIFMRVAALDWHVPPGRADYCGGNAMFRREVLERVGGFDESLMAGEEPELCLRIRSRGLAIQCLDKPMVEHDLDMTSFGEYWRRAVRTGWAICVVGLAYRADVGRLWLRQNLVNLIEVSIWIALLAFGLAGRSWWTILALGGLLVVRTTWIARNVRSRADGWVSAFLYGVHCQFVRIPMCIGQFSGIWHVAQRRLARSVENRP